VVRLWEALENVGLKVYAPRAGSFLKVEESVAVFGVLLHILGKVARGHYPGKDFQDYTEWLDGAYQVADEVIQNDPLLKRYVEDTKSEITTAKKDYELLFTAIEQKKWQLDQPYEINVMKRHLVNVTGISKRAQRNILSGYFDRVVEQRKAIGKPISLSYVLTRSTSLDWTILDLFYRLFTFNYFKAMIDLAETGGDEGPICNLCLISQYLSRFMDLYRPVISADVLIEDKYQNWLFGSFLYALFRLGESGYENPEDPFPKGRIPFLTIHQAKGLEFPVVVFGNPRKSNKGVQPVERIVHPLIERQGEPLDKIPEFDMMRLFYVALSRAKNLLIIPHWSSAGNYVSPPLRDLLDEDHLIRIPDFDITTLPEAKMDKADLPKNYSYTSDYLQYKKCPRQYMIFRKYNFVPSRSQTMFFGNLVHHTLEDLHQHLIALRTQP
jgi:DNA helicase-2/ATP-dependent DNA helicase PcrA